MLWQGVFIIHFATAAEACKERKAFLCLYVIYITLKILVKLSEFQVVSGNTSGSMLPRPIQVFMYIPVNAIEQGVCVRALNNGR